MFSSISSIATLSRSLGGSLFSIWSNRFEAEYAIFLLACKFVEIDFEMIMLFWFEFDLFCFVSRCLGATGSSR